MSHKIENEQQPNLSQENRESALPGQTSEGRRRSLLSLGVPALLAAVVSGCGKFIMGSNDFSGKTRAGGPKADPKEDDGKGAVPPGTPGKKPGNEDAACELDAHAAVPIAGLTPDASLIYKHALYGPKKNTLLAVKFAAGQASAGDYVYILRPGASASEATAIASKRLGSVQAAQPIIFDGINLSTTDSLSVLLVKGNGTKRLATLDCRISVYANKWKGKDLFDAWTELSVPHINYGSMTPYATFGKLDGGHQHKASASPAANGSLMVANSSSTWAGSGAAFHQLHDNGGHPFEVVDAVGDPLPLNGSTLSSTNTYIIYLQDGGHYHRYFYFIG